MPALKARGNVTFSYNGTALTAYLNLAKLNQTINEIETTNFASTGGEKIAGTGQYTIEIGGDWSKALHDVLSPDAVTPPATLRNAILTMGSGGDLVTWTWTAKAFVASYNPDASDPNGKLTFTGSIAVSGAPVVS
jgi:hypothetical protein